MSYRWTFGKLTSAVVATCAIAFLRISNREAIIESSQLTFARPYFILCSILSVS